MQSKEFKVFKVTVNYSENDQPANNVELIEFPSDIDTKNAILLHHLLQSYRTTKNKNRRLVFDEIDNTTENKTLDEKIALLQKTPFNKTLNSDEPASKEQELLVIQSTLSKEEFFRYIESCVANNITAATSKIGNSNFWIHRSTLMGVAIVISAILLVLAFTVSLPVMEVLMSIFGALLIVSLSASSFKTFFDFVSNLVNFLCSKNDLFKQTIDWIKNNPAQTIIAAVGVGLSLVGLGAMIGFFPIIGPALTLACGCSLFIYAVVLAVFGPTTIADAINRHIDVHEAENVLEDFKGEKQITLVPVNEPQNPTAKVLKAIFSKDVDQNKDEENNSKLDEIQGDPIRVKIN